MNMGMRQLLSKFLVFRWAPIWFLNRLPPSSMFIRRSPMKGLLISQMLMLGSSACFEETPFDANESSGDVSAGDSLDGGSDATNADSASTSTVGGEETISGATGAMTNESSLSDSTSGTMESASMTMSTSSEEDAGTESSSNSDSSESTTSSSSTTSVEDETDLEESDSSASTDAEESSSEDEGPAECPDSYQCVPSPPSGWEGPVAGILGSGSLSCPNPFPEKSKQAFADLNPGKGQCDCDCGVWQGRCGDVVIAGEVDESIPPEVCSKTPILIGELRAEVEGASCPDVEVDERISIPSWKSLALACGGANVLPGCDSDELCLPKPPPEFSMGICIFRSDDHACPKEFLDKQLVYGRFEDDRQCSSCKCSASEGTCTGSYKEYSLRTNGRCEDFVRTLAVPGEVPDLHFAAVYAQWSPDQASGSCSVSAESQLVGEVYPRDATTFCCRSN